MGVSSTSATGVVPVVVFTFTRKRTDMIISRLWVWM